MTSRPAAASAQISLARYLTIGSPQATPPTRRTPTSKPPCLVPTAPVMPGQLGPSPASSWLRLLCPLRGPVLISPFPQVSSGDSVRPCRGWGFQSLQSILPHLSLSIPNTCPPIAAPFKIILQPSCSDPQVHLQPLLPSLLHDHPPTPACSEAQASPDSSCSQLSPLTQPCPSLAPHTPRLHSGLDFS